MVHNQSLKLKFFISNSTCSIRYSISHITKLVLSQKGLFIPKSQSPLCSEKISTLNQFVYLSLPDHGCNRNNKLDLST